MFHSLLLSQIIMRQMVDTAIQMHANGVFHRDIKLENILIELESGVPRARVIDFGCGCFVREGCYSYFSGMTCGFCFCSSVSFQSLKRLSCLKEASLSPVLSNDPSIFVSIPVYSRYHRKSPSRMVPGQGIQGQSHNSVAAGSTVVRPAGSRRVV